MDRLIMASVLCGVMCFIGLAVALNAFMSEKRRCCFLAILSAVILFFGCVGTAIVGLVTS